MRVWTVEFVTVVSFFLYTAVAIVMGMIGIFRIRYLCNHFDNQKREKKVERWTIAIILIMIGWMVMLYIAQYILR